jgi:hypothetical protein
MSKLACTIALYRPDPDLLASKFRYWHLDALLHQADRLMQRCLEDFKDYSALDYQWNLFQVDLEAQEKKVGLYTQTAVEGIFERAAAPALEEPAQSDTVQEPLELLETVAEEPPPAQPEPSAEPIKSSLDLRAEAVQRKRELAAPGRPFALDEQRDLVLKRLCRDYEEAVDRACVAEVGFRRLYDYPGLSSPLPSEAETLGASLTTLAIWIRNALEWLAGYRQKAVPFTRAVSVRSLLNRNAWALLKHSRDSYALKIQIPVDLFRGHDNCQITGVGAVLVGEAGTVPWSAVLRIPGEAVYERGGLSVNVDQSDRPSCLLGRVESRRSTRPVQICGAGSLAKASPVGRSTQDGLWSLEIFKPVGAHSESFGHLEDVILEIHATGVPQKTAE